MNILGIVGVAGLLTAMFMAVVLFGPYFDLNLNWFTLEENTSIVILAIAITLAVLGLGTLQKTAAKSTKDAIADFANPILKSKGKVSAREIAEKPFKKKIEIDILIKTYLEPMLNEGFFEGARLENGWLVKDVTVCEYCGATVQSTDKKCHNCGATIKK